MIKLFYKYYFKIINYLENERSANLSIKKSFFILGILDFLFIGTYFVYLASPIYLGYYPIGIAQLILLAFCFLYLVFYTKKYIFISIKKWKPLAIFIFAGYIVSILFMLYSLFVWYAFMP